MAKKQEIQIPVNTALQANITPIGIEFSRNNILLGENYCRIYGIINYPSEAEYGWCAKLTNIPGTIVSINYEPTDNGALMSVMNKNININRGLAASAKDSLERQRRNKAADNMEYAIEQMDQYNEKMGEFNMTVMVLSRSEEDFRERCTRVESICNSMNCRIRILSNVQKEGYQQIAPTYAQNKTISEMTRRVLPIRAFVGGFPFAASGFNDGSGYYLGKDSDGGIIMLDLWKRSKSRTNSNITITGTSGSGKSTAMKHIVTSEYARGTKVIIIDPEGEYKEMCRNSYFNGSWVDVAGGRGGIINPLQIRPAPRDDDEDGDETLSGIGDMAIHIKTLHTFFDLYIPSLTDRLSALLEKALIECYQAFGITWDTDVTKLTNDKFPTFTNLYNIIKHHALPDSEYAEDYQELLLYLESAANGADKGLWNGHTTLSPHSNFIVLDTKSLTQMSGNILSAQYFNVLSWCWEQMSCDKTNRVMLIADECWMMIDPRVPQSMIFLRNFEKRARKYNGSIVVATQSIVDFLDPSVKMYGQQVLDLPSIKFIFGADGQSLEETRNVFSLNEAQYDLVASKQRGLALMKIGSQAVKVRFALSDERLELFGKGGGL